MRTTPAIKPIALTAYPPSISGAGTAQTKEARETSKTAIPKIFISEGPFLDILAITYRVVNLPN